MALSEELSALIHIKNHTQKTITTWVIFNHCQQQHQPEEHVGFLKSGGCYGRGGKKKAKTLKSELLTTCLRGPLSDTLLSFSLAFYLFSFFDLFPVTQVINAQMPKQLYKPFNVKEVHKGFRLLEESSFGP